MTGVVAVLLWGSLQPGAYQAGFRSSWASDSSRVYDVGRKPRPILIDVWYPALRNDLPRFPYRDYFKLPADPTGFGQRLSRFAVKTAAEGIFHNAKQDQAAFDRFLSTTVFAAKDAPPAEGRFPVVLYHSGAAGSYEDNTALFEYLASHGYVVISSAYQSIDSSYVGNNHGSGEASIRDMGFLAAFAATLPFADSQRLAAMGHSAGAQTILQWLGEPDCPLDAAVSLDTTVEYDGLNTRIRASYRKTLEDNEDRPRVPILLFASSERHPKFDTWDDYLGYAPRYFAATKNLSHGDYVMHGAIYGTPALRAGYDRVCTVTLHFLDAVLKQSPAALRADSDVRYHAGEPHPPTARQIAADAGKLPAQSDRESLYQAGVLLLEDGRSDDAAAIQQTVAARFPKSYLGPLLLGQILAARGKDAAATSAFEQARQRVGADRKLSRILKMIYAQQIQTASGNSVKLESSHEIK